MPRECNESSAAPAEYCGKPIDMENLRLLVEEVKRDHPEEDWKDADLEIIRLDQREQWGDFEQEWIVIGRNTKGTLYCGVNSLGSDARETKIISRLDKILGAQRYAFNKRMEMCWKVAVGVGLPTAGAVATYIGLLIYSAVTKN